MQGAGISLIFGGLENIRAEVILVDQRAPLWRAHSFEMSRRCFESVVIGFPLPLIIFAQTVERGSQR